MQDQTVYWPPATRAAFRFVFSYLVLYSLYTCDILQTIFRHLAVGKYPPGLLDPLTQRIVPWVGRHLLRLSKNMTFFGGDSTYEWVLVLCYLVLALAAAVVWSAFDRRRPNYRKLHAWLRLLVRLVLASAMFGYGFAKVVPRQFGDLTLTRLAAPFGSSDRFLILWGFMATSRGYTILGGLVEVLGGMLLLIPRLTTLGSLLSTVALVNVFALNMFYDVPVKLFSLHLLLMAVFLAAPDFPRLANLLVFNQPVPAAPATPLSESSGIRRGAPMIATVLGVLMFCAGFLLNWRAYDRERVASAGSWPPVIDRVKPPYYGIWIVDDLVVGGPPGHALFTDKLREDMGLQAGDERWKSLIFEHSKQLVIQCSNDVMDNVTLDLDAAGNTAALSDDADPKWKGLLTLSQPGMGLLSIRGTVNGSEISARLHRLDESKLRLTNRVFRFTTD